MASAKPFCQLVVLIKYWNIPEHCRVDLYYVCLCGRTPMHLLERTRTIVKQGVVGDGLNILFCLFAATHFLLSFYTRETIYPIENELLNYPTGS